MCPVCRWGKAVEGYRTPRRFARFGGALKSGRVWSAPALWRFGDALAAVPAESFAAVMGPLGTVPAVPKKMAYGAGLTG